MKPESSTVTQRIHSHHHGEFYKDVIQFDAGGVTLSLLRKRPSSLLCKSAVLLVHGFGQNRYSWHSTHRSFSGFLAHAGYDVFSLDLRGHGRSQSSVASFAHYAEQDIPAAISHILSLTKRERLFLIGHSMGGALAYHAASKRPEQLQGVVTFAGLFSYGRGLPIIRTLERLTRLLLPRLRGVPFDLQLISKVLLPRLSLLEPILYAAQALPWYPGSMERPLLEEYLTRSFDADSFLVMEEIFRWLRAGSFGASAQTEEDFFSQDIPLLILSGSRDFLNHPKGVRPAYDGSRSRDKTYHEFSKEQHGVHFGHVDLILGKDAPRIVWPIVKQWLDARS